MMLGTKIPCTRLQVLYLTKKNRYLNLSDFNASHRTLYKIASTEPLLLRINNEKEGTFFAPITLEELALLTNCAGEQFQNHIFQYLQEEKSFFLAWLCSKKLMNLLSGTLVLIAEEKDYKSYSFQKNAFQDGKRNGFRVLFEKRFQKVLFDDKKKEFLCMKNEKN